MAGEFTGMWNQAPSTPLMSSNYGTGLYGSNPAAGGWATGNANIDRYISTIDSALKNGRVGGAQKMKEDLDWATRMAGMNGGASGSGSGAGGPPQITAPSMGGSSQPNPYEERLNNLMSNPDSIANSGVYKFAFDQGQNALERSAAAKGMTGSGNTLAELVKYGQGVASQNYNTEANRLGELVRGRDSTNASRYGADVGANASMWNTAQKVNSDNYWADKNFALKSQELAQRGSYGGGSYGGSSNALERGSSRFAPVRQQDPFGSSNFQTWDAQWANRNKPNAY